MENVLERVIKWFRRISFYRAKFAAFTLLASAFGFSLGIEIDFERPSLVVKESALELSLGVLLIISVLIMIYWNFRLQKIKSADRKSEQMLKTLRDPGVPTSVKEKLLDFSFREGLKKKK